MIRSQGLRAVLWDVDGTLADTEMEGHRRAFNQAFAAAGMPWRWDGSTYRTLLAISGGRERIRHYLETIASDPLPDPQIEALMAAKQQAYGTLAREGLLPLLPGVGRLVNEVAGHGLAQALVTTSSRSAVAALLEGHGAELAGAFSFWVCGEDVGRKKPDPEGYRLALERLQLPPDQVLVVEDSPQGLAAARQGGLPCLLTLGDLPGPGAEPWWLEATATVTHLGEGDAPTTVVHGPPCHQGRVTLSWLEELVAPR